MTVMQGSEPKGGYAAHVDTSLDAQASLVDMLRTRPGGRSWTEIAADLLQVGDIDAVAAELEPDALFLTAEREDDKARARADVERWKDEGLSFIPITDERYPARVREIHEAPPFLFASGRLREDDVAVSVVGSRVASSTGLRSAAGIARALVDRGVSVISGLAKGIDSAAHTATLEAGGRPVGLIATGITRVYPAENRGLHTAVSERGLLLSQFWPDAPPQRHNFLMRNATMSGYGVATVVVEAGEQSGARAQARMAVQHGRPVILTDMVVERNEWARALLDRPGVTVASSTREVLDAVETLLHEPHAVTNMLDSLVTA